MSTTTSYIGTRPHRSSSEATSLQNWVAGAAHRLLGDIRGSLWDCGVGLLRASLNFYKTRA
jgi:hypothetical protein